jgi:hypothetical protein
VDATSSGVCQMAKFDISGAEPSGSNTCRSVGWLASWDIGSFKNGG